MTRRIRHLWSAVLRRARLRPPEGHMAMLRGEVGRREDERLAREVATGERQARRAMEPNDDTGG